MSWDLLCRIHCLFYYLLDCVDYLLCLTRFPYADINMKTTELWMLPLQMVVHMLKAEAMATIN